MSILKRTLSLAMATALMTCSMTAFAADDFKAPPVGRTSTESITKSSAAPKKQAAPNTTVLEGIDANGEKTTVSTTTNGSTKTTTTTKSAGGLSSSITITTDVSDKQSAIKGTPDSKPPVLQALSVDQKSVTAPGKIEITASATDDVSGVDHIFVVMCKVNNDDKRLEAYCENKYYDETLYDYVPYSDGLFHGIIEISQYEPSAIYRVDTVIVEDVAGNQSWYHPKNYEYPVRNAKELTKEQTISFSVKNG